MGTNISGEKMFGSLNAGKQIRRAAAVALEALESRRLFAVHTWAHAGDGNWSDPANWQEGTAPQPGESDVIINISNITPASTNDISGLTISEIHIGHISTDIGGLPFTLTGGIFSGSANPGA